MRYLLIIILLLFGIMGFCQEDTTKYQKYPTAYGPQYKDIWATRTLRLPDTSYKPQSGVKGAVATDITGKSLFAWDGATWVQGQNGIDSIFITNSDSIFIITNNNDTIFIGNATNAVDTIYQRGPDSIFAVKNGVEFVAAVTGASAPSGGMDTAYTRNDSIIGLKNNGEFLISEVQANIDSIFITRSDSIFIISGNDTIFIGQSNAMDSAYQRNDSIFGSKGGNEFFISLTGNAAISLQPLSNGFGILPFTYDGRSPQLVVVDTSVLNQTIFIDSSTTEFFVDTIANAPPPGALNGATVLVGTSPTGLFAGHANEIATLTGAVWSFQIPNAGDNLVLSNDTQPTTFYQYTGSEWVLRKRALSIGGDRIGSNIDAGTLDNRPFRILTNGNVRERLDAQGRHYFNKFVGTPSSNYLKIDSATGRLDTASFTPLTLTTVGSSGAATLSNDTLNIPIYTGGGSVLVVDVKDFGAIGDSVTNDRPAIQAAFDYAALHKMPVYVSPAPVAYRLAGDTPLYANSHQIIIGSGTRGWIVNDKPTLTVSGDLTPIFFGNYAPGSYDTVNQRYYHATAMNDNRVTLQNSGDLSNFHAGQIVLLHGRTGWYNADGDFKPYVLRVNKVIGTSGSNIVLLEEPIDTTLSTSLIGITGDFVGTGGGSFADDAFNHPSYFAEDVHVYNLAWKSTSGPILLKTSCYKCQFDNVDLYGIDGIGGNGWAYSTWNNFRSTYTRGQWSEVSIGSHDLLIQNGIVTYKNIGITSEPDPIIRGSENAHNITWRNILINAGSYAGRDVISLGKITNSTVDNIRFYGDSIGQNYIEFADSGADTSIVSGNKVINSSFNGLSHLQNFVNFNSSTPPSQNILTNNTVANNVFNDVSTGTASHTVTMGGVKTDIFNNKFYSNHDMQAGTYTSGSFVRQNFMHDPNQTITGVTKWWNYNDTSTQASGGSGGGTTTNALTVNNGGAGDASPFTFDGSVSKTLSYNSIGAVPTSRTINGKALSSNITLGLASSDFANQGTTTTVLHGNASGNPSFAAVGLTTDVTGTLPFTNGGLGFSTATNGDILYYNSGWQKLAIGSNGSILGIESGLPTWAATLLADTIPRTIYARTNAVRTPKVTLADTVTATSSVQQWSPALYLEGRGWTTSSVSKQSIWAIYNQALSSGGTNADANLTFDFFNGTSFSNRMTLLGSTGALTLTGSGSGITCTGNSNLGATGASNFSVSAANLHTTSTDAYLVRNSTNATVGNPVEISPRIRWSGQGYTGSVSQTADFIAEEIPVNGTSPITSYLKFSAQIASGGYSEVFRITNGGNITATGAVSSARPPIYTGSTPTNSAGTGAGTGPTISITGNDAAGYVSIATGTSPTASGDIVTITFSTALTNTPKSIVLTAANANAATEIAKIYVDQSTASSSAFKIKNTSSALTASTTYLYYYQVTQ